MRRVGFCYHPNVPGARELAERLASQADGSVEETWLAPVSWDDEGAPLAGRMEETDLLVCAGGDGTVLHASGIASVSGTPVLGVRMGRLGFLTEGTGDEAEDLLRRALDGEGRVEHRSMVRAQAGDDAPVDALNDIVVGRRSPGRTISVGARVDGVLIAEYRADAVIVASATGSTGYALSAGGPILHPTAQDLLLVPVAPHLTRHNALVLPGGSRIGLEVERGFDAVMTADGQRERALSSGTVVSVSRSPLTARFLRLGGDRDQFYGNLARRLGWLRRDHVLDERDEVSPDGEQRASTEDRSA